MPIGDVNHSGFISNIHKNDLVSDYTTTQVGQQPTTLNGSGLHDIFPTS